jgi:RNA polymerase sigma-70 factor (ECF subfamily)
MTAVGAGSAAGGGEAARMDFHDVVARFETPLLRYAGRLLAPDPDGKAEDVVQETFLRLHRHAAGNRDGIGNIQAWLFRVVHNLSLDALRKRAIEKEGRSDDRAAPADPVDGLGELIRKEAGARALEELARLTPDQKQAILLKLIHGMTLREIAGVMGITTGAVDYKLGQGLRELTRKLKAAGVM